MSRPTHPPGGPGSRLGKHSLDPPDPSTATGGGNRIRTATATAVTT